LFFYLGFWLFDKHSLREPKLAENKFPQNKPAVQFAFSELVKNW
jgi:hypothetical protein